MMPVQHSDSQRVSAVAVTAGGVCPLVAVKKKHKCINKERSWQKVKTGQQAGR